MNEFDWLMELTKQCEGKSQRQVAAELGVSPAMVNQVLKGTYKGSLETIRIKVEGLYLNSCVNCPVLGEIPIHECKNNQDRPFSASNPLRVKVFRACRAGCPYSSLENTAKTQRITPVGGEDENSRYPLEAQIDFCRRMAGGDQGKFSELLERELRKVANQYNALQWEVRHKRGNRG